MERDGHDGTGQEIVRLLREVADGLGALATRFAARHGTHPTDIRALSCLLDARDTGVPLTAGRLGARLGLNSAGTTALVDRLERLGHVRRVRDTHDRRRVLVVLEETSVPFGRSVHEPLADRSAILLKGYDEHQLAALREFLEDVRAAVRVSDG